MIDFDLPVFTFYINVNNLTPEKTQETINVLANRLYESLGNNFFILPVVNQDTKIETLWKGKYENSDTSELFKEKITNILDIIEDGIKDSNIKEKLRNILLKDIGI